MRAFLLKLYTTDATLQTLPPGNFIYTLGSAQNKQIDAKKNDRRRLLVVTEL